MLDASDRAIDLIVGHIKHELNAEQKLELNHWLDSSVQNRSFFNYIMDPENRRAAWERYNQADSDPAWALLRQQLPALPVSYKPMASIKRIPYFRWAVAVLLPLVVLLAVWQWNTRSTKMPGFQKQTSTPAAPSASFVSLTLANDSVITLNHTADGLVANQGNMQVIKTNDVLIYQSRHPESSSNAYGPHSANRLETPTGQMYRLKLSDGTDVWLSARSTLRYPPIFEGPERFVYLSGEAYFEVTPGNKPFVVKTESTLVTVHGTKFTVRDYPGDTGAITTVQQGSVMVNSVMVRAGQEARVTANGLKVVTNRKPEDAAAWKMGFFKFTQATLTDILPSLKYWHGYEAQWINARPSGRQSTGTLNLKDDIRPLARTLERNFGVRITVDTTHRKLIITP